MENKERDVIVGGGPDRLTAAVALHGETFKTDPVLNFLLHTMPEKQRTDYIPQLMYHLLKAASLKEARFDEAWSSTRSSDANAAPACSAVWLEEGRTVDDWRVWLPAGFHRMLWNVGVGGCKRMLVDFQSVTDKLKNQGLRNPDGTKIKNFHYLFFISTAAEARGQGLSSELIRRHQVRASEKGVPIWLESTTERSHRLYLKLGFKDIDMWRIGKGAVDADGHTKSGGEGVPIWAMLWWPEEKKDTGASKDVAESMTTDASRKD